jgi:hypothetical protein
VQRFGIGQPTSHPGLPAPCIMFLSRDRDRKDAGSALHAAKEDWFTNPKSGEVVDFIDFARSEGRFAKRFDKEGNPSETAYAKQDRLENWHLLLQLAGLR